MQFKAVQPDFFTYREIIQQLQSRYNKKNILEFSLDLLRKVNATMYDKNLESLNWKLKQFKDFFFLESSELSS